MGLVAKTARASAAAGGEPVTRQPVDTRTTGQVGKGGRKYAGKSVGPPGIELDERKEQNVWERQPHRAKLGEPRQARIEDAAGDVEMGNRIAIVEHGVVPPTPRDRCKGEYCAAGQYP